MTLPTDPDGPNGARLSLGDVFIFAGAALLLTGLFLFDWRLAMAAVGGLLLLLGWFMLFKPGNGR